MSLSEGRLSSVASLACNVNATFTPSHRGGSGPPLVLLHGFIDTWRTWDLVLPELERHHDVLAPALVGPRGRAAADGGGHPRPPARRDRARDGRRGLRDRPHRRQLARRLSRAAARGARPRALGRRARPRRAAGRRATTPTWRRSTSSRSSRSRCARSRRTRKRSCSRAKGAAAPRSTRRSTSSTSPPSCSPTRRAPSRPARASRPMVEYAKREGYHLDAEQDHLPGAGRVGDGGQAPRRGRRPPCATAPSGSRTPTGSSSTASATAPSSTCRSRPPS